MTQGLFDLTGKTAAVIGAGSGIGEAVALGCAGQGARVVCLDVNVEAAQRVAAKGTAAGGLCEAGAIDICDGPGVERVFTELDAKYGVDIVICTPGHQRAQADPQVFRRGAVAGDRRQYQGELQRAARGRAGHDRAPRRAASFCFSSIRSQSVEPGQGVYAATKAGIVQLAKTAAAEFGPHGVRVNAIAPGVIETPLTAPIKANKAWYDAYAAKSVFNRWGRPEELVGAAVFLASDAASFVTGSTVFVDGGWLAADGRFTPPGM